MLACMPNSNALFSLFAVLTLLPGCVTWNTGERIRETAVTYTGVNVSRPLNGCEYESPSHLGYVYRQAPEVTYRERTPLVRVPLLETGEEVKAVDVQDTGKICWVRRKALIKEKCSPWEVLSAPPADLMLARTLSSVETEPCAKDMGGIGNAPDAAYARANLLSAPCRYVVDPVLTVASTTAAIPIAAAGGSIYGLWTLLFHPVKKAANAVLPNEADADGITMPEAPVLYD